MESQPTIAIISPEQAPYSATFIKAHIDLLPADVRHLFGIFFPTGSADGQYVLRENEFLRKAFYKLKLIRTYQGLLKEPPLARYLRQEKVQSVLAEFGPVGAEVLRVCQRLHLPLIVHFHGYDAYAHVFLDQYKKLYQEMFEYASYLIVVSQHMKDQLLRLGAPEDKLVLNPYGPHDAFFEINSTFETKTFVAVGRFVEKKAPHYTLAAFKKVLEKVPEARLVMAGDGPLLPTCRELVRQGGIQSAVTFVGAASHQEIINLYTMAYCFVQHSVVASNGDSEGTPVAILEAQAAGLPVVSTRHAGIQDVIMHEETGFLVGEQDVEAMARFMIALTQDTALTKRLGQKGRERVKEHYTMSKHIATINHIIKASINDTVVPKNATNA